MESNMTVPVLVEVTRGPEVESRHRGQIAVVDGGGNLVRQLGDPETRVCMRSLAKPFQALAVITTGAAAAFGVGPPHHAGAGKHTAMLALCVHHGWPLDDYLAVDHPVQQLILGTVARMVGVPPAQIAVAIDGCGAPVFYVPLKNIALGYARLAAAQPGSPAGTLLAAILAHPRHIAGDGRLDTEVLLALPGAVVAKSGAEGGYALALTERGLGVALKIEDGASRALNPTVVAVLEQLGVLTPTAREALKAYAQPPILNHRKGEVG